MYTYMYMCIDGGIQDSYHERQGPESSTSGYAGPLEALRGSRQSAAKEFKSSNHSSDTGPILGGHRIYWSP